MNPVLTNLGDVVDVLEKILACLEGIRSRLDQAALGRTTERIVVNGIDPESLDPKF